MLLQQHLPTPNNQSKKKKPKHVSVSGMYLFNYLWVKRFYGEKVENKETKKKHATKWWNGKNIDMMVLQISSVICKQR